ncbi:hypothetical protein OGH69_01050 [Flavobacterium sp. MFBS3-15]|uniref:hypothetical protein n=1 Tax=Flavobacterium sp. MFBS3-15 TaxID=2989816 RepID=UPI002235E9A4|nr:hypothetical protein [Flavobacterium sp. MFBS3-15]MCW4467542.1 hypothetical protein [Flavobacterium sp. MFBS3-15]
MKRLFLLFWLFAITLIIGCSSEEDLKINESSAIEGEGNLEQMSRGSADFRTLFTTLYGSSSYRIDAARSEIREAGISYYVTEIYATSSGTETLRGYLLETPSEDFYMEHIRSTSTLNQYSILGSGYKRNSFDLSHDTLYQSGGFTPFSTSSERLIKPRRFFGSSIENGSCGPNSNGDGGCSYGQYYTYYAFWIATNDTPKQVMTINPNTGNEVPATFPCDCPPG